MFEMATDARLEAPTSTLPTWTVATGATTTTTRTITLRTSLVDGQRATFELLAVQTVDRRLCLGVAHLDEAESFRISGKLVFDDRRRSYSTELFEERPKVSLRNPIGQISHVNIHKKLLN